MHRCVVIDEVLHSGLVVIARGVPRSGWMIKRRHQCYFMKSTEACPCQLV